MPPTAPSDPTPTPSFADALARVHDRIERARTSAGRDDGDEVRLLLATKTQDADDVRAAVLADRAAGRPGEVLVGENRVQELTAKAPALADLALTTHLIGPLQSNKINHALRALAQHDRACIETVDSVDLAEKIGNRALAATAATGGGGTGTLLDVYVQVNVSGEESKAGVSPEAAVDLALAVAEVDGLRLSGLMTIGARSPDERRVRAGFARLRELRDEVLGSGASGTSATTELSMGMSQDLEWAVAEGATLVRVGSAVFGAR